MSNSAIITTENGWNNKENHLGIYLRWNGGLGSVEGFLKYCELKGYTSPEVRDCDNWVYLIQVISNFFGDGQSLEVNTVEKLQNYGTCNGIYIIKDWKIIDRKYFEGPEEREYELLEFLETIDIRMPEHEKLGTDFLHAKEIPTSDLKLGDTVFVREFRPVYDKYTIIGFGETEDLDGSNVKVIPYINRFCCEDIDYENNVNNYITSETIRVHEKSY